MPFDMSPEYTIPADDLEAARILREAADLVKCRGWHNHFNHPGGRLCAMEAIMEVVGGGHWAYAEFKPAGRALADYLGIPTVRLYNWNDGTRYFAINNAENVIAAMNNAASWLLAGRPGP